jgi:hypothetical protein
VRELGDSARESVVCSEGEIVTSDDKRQKDKPKLVPHQRSQVAGEKVKTAKRSSEIT